MVVYRKICSENKQISEVFTFKIKNERKIPLQSSMYALHPPNPFPIPKSVKLPLDCRLPILPFHKWVWNPSFPLITRPLEAFIWILDRGDVFLIPELFCPVKEHQAQFHKAGHSIISEMDLESLHSSSQLLPFHWLLDRLRLSSGYWELRWAILRWKAKIRL